MRVDLCRYWPSLQPHLTALLFDVKMTFLINDPVSLCLPGLLFLGMSFSLFSTFCVLIFFQYCAWVLLRGMRIKGPFTMHEPVPGIVSNFLCNLSHFIPSTYHDIITIATSTLQGRKVMFRGVKSFAMQLERSFKYRSVCLSQKSCFLFSFFFSY